MQFPITPSDAGVCELKITVDFMNNLMGGGNPYPTVVTLALDFANAQVDTSALSDLLKSYEDLVKEDYTEDSWNTFEAKVKEAEGIACKMAEHRQQKSMR